MKADAGKRLDHFLQDRMPDYSRSRLQEWIKAGRVSINGRPATKPSLLLRGEEDVDVEPAPPAPLKAFPEDLPVRVLYQDPAVIAIDKPAGMTVHAGAGRHSGTLVNALLHRFPSLSTAGGDERPGIVHRLDKDTSGVILIARNDAAHRHLAAQFASRRVEKTYLALVQGKLATTHGRIDKPIERDPVRRTRMTARTGRGRTALTEYRVLASSPCFSFLEVRIHTGRTHQIRVHMAAIGHPVAGDTLYGAAATTHGRFFLHAHRIVFTSPASAQPVTVVSSLPAGLEEWKNAALALQ